MNFRILTQCVFTLSIPPTWLGVMTMTLMTSLHLVYSIFLYIAKTIFLSNHRPSRNNHDVTLLRAADGWVSGSSCWNSRAGTVPKFSIRRISNIHL